jgi:hypothetical protein
MQVAVTHHGYMEPYTDYFALILSQPIEKTYASVFVKVLN